MAAMDYSGDLARIQQKLAQCHDLIARRTAIMAALNLRAGETVLDIGCGGGYYAYQAGAFVGPGGRVSAIDLSAEQVAAARALCSEFPWVQCDVGDAAQLPYDDSSFDAVFAVQTIEYIPDLEGVLREIRRVLRPNGRTLVASTIWNSLIWHSRNPERMQRVLAAWNEHCPYPDLPTTLAMRLRQARFHTVQQVPLPLLNMSYHPHSYIFWGSRLIHAFVVDSGRIPGEEADAWISEFDVLESEGANFCCVTPVITTAIRA